MKTVPPVVTGIPNRVVVEPTGDVIVPQQHHQLLQPQQHSSVDWQHLQTLATPQNGQQTINNPQNILVVPQDVVPQQGKEHLASPDDPAVDSYCSFTFFFFLKSIPTVF